MEFGPIWRAALRNKTGVVLIVLQVAFTMAMPADAAELNVVRARRLWPRSIVQPPLIEQTSFPVEKICHLLTGYRCAHAGSLPCVRLPVALRRPAFDPTAPTTRASAPRR